MATGQIKDGDARFSLGMDSVSDPETLPAESYTLLVNMLNRGGALQTRPGFRRMFTLPEGNLQGLTVYTPRVGSPTLVAFVSGQGYISSFPFRDFQAIPGATMSTEAKKVYFAQTVKAVERNPDGSLTLITPRVLLMVQDGINPPAYFDGQSLTALTGPLVTPQGTHMAWAGSRLWVARREQIFASDIADPLSFVEQIYNTLGGTNSFFLPGQCTGLATLPSSSSVNSPLLAFTDSTTSMFQANILNRANWPSVENFQSVLFTTLGCVSDRSITGHAGMLWWYSDFGSVRLDSASNSNVTSKIDYIDREMVRSGKALNTDLSGVASAHYENFVLTSVPYASKRNEHTWVWDSSTNDLKEGDFPSAWAAIWTGINPVQWAEVRETANNTRLFAASVDGDGKNRIYEAFTADRRDNGCDIPWVFESRNYSAGTPFPKHFRWVEYYLSEMAGQVDLNISWAGSSRGRWKTIASPSFLAREGNIEAAVDYGAADMLFALKKQSRAARTQDVRDIEEDSLSSQGVEGFLSEVEQNKEAIDKSFAIRISGSGQCAIRGILLYMDPTSAVDSGMQDLEEADNHFVRFDGAAADTEEELEVSPTSYSSSATVTAQIGQYTATATATVVSEVSLKDATKRAEQVARERAEAQLLRIIPPYEAQ